MKKLNPKVYERFSAARHFTDLSAADQSAIEKHLADNAGWLNQLQQAMHRPKFQKQLFAISSDATRHCPGFDYHTKMLYTRTRYLLTKGKEYEITMLEELRQWHSFLGKMEQGGFDFFGWLVWSASHQRLQENLRFWLAGTAKDDASILSTIQQFQVPGLQEIPGIWRTTCANEWRQISKQSAALADSGAGGEAAWLNMLAQSEAASEVMAETLDGVMPKKGKTGKSEDFAPSPIVKTAQIVDKLLEQWKDPSARPAGVKQALEARLKFDWEAFQKAEEAEFVFLANLVLNLPSTSEMNRILKERAQSWSNLKESSSELDPHLGTREGRVSPVKSADVVLAGWRALQSARMTKILAAWLIHQRAKPSAPAPGSLVEFVTPPHFPKQTLIDPLSNQPFYYNAERGCIDHSAQAAQPWASSRTEVILPHFPKTTPKPSRVPARIAPPRVRN